MTLISLKVDQRCTYLLNSLKQKVTVRPCLASSTFINSSALLLTKVCPKCEDGWTRSKPVNGTWKLPRCGLHHAKWLWIRRCSSHEGNEIPAVHIGRLLGREDYGDRKQTNWHDKAQTATTSFASAYWKAVWAKLTKYEMFSAFSKPPSSSNHNGCTKWYSVTTGFRLCLQIIIFSKSHCLVMRETSVQRCKKRSAPCQATILQTAIVP